MMNTLAIAMIKNEADIVEAFVRHNLCFLDLLVVIDNGSTDGTRDILTALQREGLPVLVFDDPIFGYFQSEKVTHVYRKVVPVYQPEVVYFLDADEFIQAPSRAALEAAYARMAPGTCALLPWATHVPTAETTPERLRTDPLGAMPGRRRQEEPTYYKAVLRRRPEDDGELVIEQGNHMVHLRSGQRPPTITIQGAAIVHLPVRSVEQLSAKVINGWHAYLVKNRHAATATMGFQWQTLYEQIVYGAGIDAATLCQVGLDYAQQPRATRTPATDVVHDPVPALYGPLRYLDLARTSLLAKVALNIESYLMGDGVTAAAPVASDASAPRRDLPGLLELMRQCDTRTLGGAPASDGTAWASELSRANPYWTTPLQGPVDLLLAPECEAEDFAAMAATAARRAAQRVVYWPQGPQTPQALRQALEQWYAQGWEPQVMQTMGLRALSTFPALRQGAIVLHPLEPTRTERAAAVRELLCSLAPATLPEPPAGLRRILHPMQDLQLEASHA